MQEIDPVTHSVVTNSFAEISREIENTVLQTARNSTIVLAHDFSVAVTDRHGDLVSATQGVPIHLGGLDLTVECLIEDGPSIGPGDIVLTNDPYGAANTHKPDFTMVTPVFGRDESPILYLALRVDQADIGGKAPTRLPVDVETSYNEGLLIPPIKVCEGDEVQTSVVELVTRNTRIEEMIKGDISSMIGALQQGRKRALELVERYGPQTVQQSTDQLLKTSQSRATERALSLPDGTYRGQSATDANPKTDDPVQIKVDVIVDGDTVTMDFSESDEQIAAPINNTLGSTYSGINTAWYTTLDPDAPFDAGYVRPLRLVAPEGLVVNAQSPAPVGYATADGVQLVMEACFDAFASMLPESTPAGWSRWVRPLTITGTDPDTDAEYWGSIASVMGGGGAIDGQDGTNLIGGIMGLGGIVAEDPERLEKVYPLHIDKMELRTDSGGAGKWRGGLGPIMAITPIDHVTTFTVGGDFGHDNPPSGRRGGKDGDVVRVFKNTAESQMEYKKAWQYITLTPKETYVQQGGGGGGIGNPFERDVDAVREDVKNGYVSRQAAKEEYGVVLTSETVEIDEEKTKDLRNNI
jgi:N-methylhydantoinase B